MAHVLLLVVAGALIFTAFEWYTSYFALNRLDKTTAILARLQQIENQNVKPRSPEIDRLKTTLVRQLRANSYERANPIGLPTMPVMSPSKRWWSFIGGAVPWFFMAFLGLIILERTREELKAIVVIVQFGVAAGVIGTFIPPYSWPLTPLLNAAVQIGLIIFIASTHEDASPSPPIADDTSTA